MERRCKSSKPARLLAAALALSATATAKAAFARELPSHERLPLQMDFDRCALAAADYGSQNLQGRIRLQLLIRKTGHVYAAFVHSERGIDDRRFEHCLTNQAVLWVLPPVELDYSRAYQISLVPGGTEIDFSNDTYWSGQHFAGPGRASVFMPDINDPPEPAELNLKAAQATLEVSDFATPSEQGIAELEVRRYGEAIRALRSALLVDADDTLALRGLAVALAESGTDLREARYLAEKLVAARPDSEASHEALLRVCLAANDDLCAYSEFNSARDASDVNPRSRALSELQPLTEKAATRLRTAARSFVQCTGQKGDDARALCVARRCLDAGTAAFADELGGQAGASYSPGDWRAAKVSEGRIVVDRTLENGKDRRDPRWLVKVGDQLVTLMPMNDDARHLTLQHNACGVTKAGQAWAKDLLKAPPAPGHAGARTQIEEPLDKLTEAKGKAKAQP